MLGLVYWQQLCGWFSGLLALRPIAEEGTLGLCPRSRQQHLLQHHFKLVSRALWWMYSPK